ncbi:hypothetical protein BC832DRAFT_552158 [Gaertneriomyces semiglobifer]|nr:hypothetical protein BC832DRAFT_552158 [Gaertneriomyces semiglobifer]
MFLTGGCLDQRLYQSVSFILVTLFVFIAGLSLFAALYQRSRNVGYTRKMTFKLTMMIFGTNVGYAITWAVWGVVLDWAGIVAWCVASEIALTWMSLTAYAYCCTEPPQGIDGSTNAWERARHRMKAQLITARAFACVTQLVLTPMDIYYRLQHNRDASSITKLLIIPSWWSSLGISAWIVYTSSHRLAGCIADLCDEMKEASRRGPRNRDGAAKAIAELREGANKIMWTGRFLSVACAFMTVNNTGVITWTTIAIIRNRPAGMQYVSYLLMLFSFALATPGVAQLWFTGVREIVHEHVPFTRPDAVPSMITTFAQQTSSGKGSEGGHFMSTIGNHTSNNPHILSAVMEAGANV